MKKRYTLSAVIFDMDGVIFDSEMVMMKAWKRLADEKGLADIETPCLQCLGLTEKACAKVMEDWYGPSFSYEKDRKIVGGYFREIVADGGMPLKPGVRETLTALRREGIKTALATSTRSQVALPELTEAGIIDLFDRITCGDMVKNSKPAPDIYLEACRVLSLSPKEAIAVEDSYNGIRSACNAGMRAVMVPDMAPATKEMEELSMTILPSLNDLIPFLFEAG